VPPLAPASATAPVVVVVVVVVVVAFERVRYRVTCYKDFKSKL